MDMSAMHMQDSAQMAGGGPSAAAGGAPALIQAAEQTPQAAVPQNGAGGAAAHNPVPGQVAAGTAVPPKSGGEFSPFEARYFPSHLLWLAITFGFFYFFMARVVLPRIGGIIETRHDRIAADLDQAARLKAESDAAVAAYQKRLAEARDKAQQIAHAAEEQAKAKAEGERKAAMEKMEKQLAESESRLAASRDDALAQVNAMAETAAAEIVAKLSGIAADQASLAQAVKAAQMQGSAV